MSVSPSPVLLLARGTLAYEGLELDVAVAVPDLEVSGGLAEGQSLSLPDLVERHGVSSAGVPSLIVSKMGFFGSLSTSKFRFEVEIDDWRIADGVKLEKASLVVETKGLVSVRGKFALGDVRIEVRAERGTTEASGWLFEGRLDPATPLELGKLIEALVKKFDAAGDPLPDDLSLLRIKSLGLRFDTDKRLFHFEFGTDWQVSNVDFVAGVAVEVKLKPVGQGAGYAYEFQASLSIDGRPVRLDIQRDGTGMRALATYTSGGQKSLGLQTLMSLILGDDAPKGFDLTLSAAVLAWIGAAPDGSRPSRYLLGAEIGTSIDLAALPLAGKLLPASTASSIALKPVYASGALSEDEYRLLVQLAEKADFVLPSDPPTGVGFSLSALLRLGDRVIEVSLPISSEPTAPQAASTQRPPPTTQSALASSDGIKWFGLNKTFGPLNLQRLGVRFRDGQIDFLLDASVSAAGLTLMLDGLGVGFRLDDLKSMDFAPKFSLRGMGIDFRNAAIEIGGAFLRHEGEKYDTFDGAATLRAKALSLSAIGSYAQTDEGPSLFVYAVLSYPLGGPSFFFVTGLAAGFGYNRRLNVPPISGVSNFILVEAATSETGLDFKTVEPRIHQATAVEPGQYFLAAGIKFQSFKLIESFLLLTVSFGNQFEIDLLGLSTMVLPTPIPGTPPITPLLVIQMAVKASFIPSMGFLGVEAQLTSNSFLFSRDCHLTGGFAFYVWFSGPRAGDFVVSIGGYHPRFSPPPGYPVVPRLGFSWRVSSQLSIEGGAYCALTPSMFMAGCSFRATWRSGDLSASFSFSADFLICWKPYYYEANISARFSVTYTFWLFGRRRLDVDLSASLDVWGPEFSGRARISLKVVSFTVEFGPGAPPPKPIGWSAFKASFLPPSDQVCGVTLQSGLVVTVKPEEKSSKDGAENWVVNAKTLVLLTNSVVPAREGVARNGSQDTRLPYKEDGRAATPREFGIAPMAKRTLERSVHAIEIAHLTENGREVVNGWFDFRSVSKNLPNALWGQTDSVKPSLGGESMRRLLSGYEIIPKPWVPSSGIAVDREKLLLDRNATDVRFEWCRRRTFRAARATKGWKPTREQATLHNDLLQELGLEADAEAHDHALFERPLVGALQTD